jgi:spore coat polysaccharide biosynthesis protein SpsF
MGSTRLPGKVLLPINGKPLLDHILFRLNRLHRHARTVVATSNAVMDDLVEAYCRTRGVHCFRGSEVNVLERYFECAQSLGFTNIVRLTADNPFTDIEELDNLINLHFSSENDFTHSFGSLPLGVGAEIFTFDALERTFLEGHEAHHIEHVDEYMIENPDIFKTGVLGIKITKQYPSLRLTIDTNDDYRRACFIAEASRCEYIDTEEAIRLCMQFA